MFDGSEQQVRLILGAMAEVARSGGTELTALDRAALGSAAELVFRIGAGLDPARLERVSPARLAEGLGERGRQAIVPLLVIATVDGRVAPAAAERLAAYAEALGVEEPAVRDLQALVHGQLDLARADMLRRNRLSITGEWVEDAASFAAWLLPYRDAPDPELRGRYEALAALPPGSFGRAPFTTSTAPTASCSPARRGRWPRPSPPPTMPPACSRATAPRPRGSCW
jgi:hypothetical protein